MSQWHLTVLLAQAHRFLFLLVRVLFSQPSDVLDCAVKNSVVFLSLFPVDILVLAHINKIYEVPWYSGLAASTS